MVPSDINPYAAPQSKLFGPDIPVPLPEAHPERYQTIWRRIAAYFIDSWIIMIPLTILEYTIFDWDYDSPNKAVYGLISIAIFILYNISMHTIFGKTLGKRIMGIAIRNLAETKTPTLLESTKMESGILLFELSTRTYFVYLILFNNQTLRQAKATLGYKISLWVLVLWLLIELIVMLANKKRRDPNDYFARTVVVIEA